MYLELRLTHILLRTPFYFIIHRQIVGCILYLFSGLCDFDSLGRLGSRGWTDQVLLTSLWRDVFPLRALITVHGWKVSVDDRRHSLVRFEEQSRQSSGCGITEDQDCIES